VLAPTAYLFFRHTKSSTSTRIRHTPAQSSTHVLVMDVWEHAYLLDYKPTERPKYIEAFFSNINWATAEQRLQKQTGARGAGA
jgi:superoxide dismutase